MVAGPLLGGLLGRVVTRRATGLRFDGYTLQVLVAARLSLGPGQTTAVFVVCGVVMVLLSLPLVLAAVGVLAFGTALVIPNLSSSVPTMSGGRFATALRLKSSASCLGQFLGPLVGGSMLAWRAKSP